jgi:hypothetical protein
MPMPGIDQGMAQRDKPTSRQNFVMMPYDLYPIHMDFFGLMRHTPNQLAALITPFLDNARKAYTPKGCIPPYALFY